MAVIGFSHGNPPAAAACIRKLNATDMAIKAPSLGPKVVLQTIFMSHTPLKMATS
jgi:hypothetical protein